MKVWHYHSEPELAIILNGTGNLYIGDAIKNFNPGDVVLIGGNLPHFWQMEEPSQKSPSYQRPQAVVIHFMESFTQCLVHIPEFSRIKQIFAKSTKGIFFSSIDINEVMGKMNQLKNCQELDRVIMILDVLKFLVDSKNQEILSCNSFSAEKNANAGNKIEKLYRYIQDNFKDGISLESAAGILNMNPSSFSRYFKKIHQKTFIQYVNEIKIGYACRILIENEMNIAEACYESGFKNLSNFNRKFKEIKKVSPTQFLKSRNFSG
ncbi:AraC family transcriptional regulator [Pleomorphovibrio marinus]|uniref:AraC family transcriptional regulator n=1 Tax=Pleomorphovibrio marinus TaxID=2164132 RepID=UPI0018E53AF4|nr:AraC family transcriptional regulator [Pleomorphovibrio marinus]